MLSSAYDRQDNCEISGLPNELRSTDSWHIFHVGLDNNSSDVTTPIENMCLRGTSNYIAVARHSEDESCYQPCTSMEFINYDNKSLFRCNFQPPRYLL